MVSIGGSSNGRTDGRTGTRSSGGPGRSPDPDEDDDLRGCGVPELIAVALADHDRDGPARWKAVSLLHRRGDLETFTEARRLCASDSPAERVLGADILGELGAPPRPFVDKSLSVLRYLAAGDDDVQVLHAVLIAFGHLGDPRALPSVVDLAGHDEASVRYGAAYALSHVLGSPPDPAGLAALRRLAADPDEDVADWAALGLMRAAGAPETAGGIASAGPA
ncbi:HEAT repeat domain-containing protein [Sphaerisporangium fuscum]|uniref:HEAT repeat domain-containing protein n=1 Tax=Sphaerisporangium fuscum TaxID=2835868 RepID=UPI001BDC316F|nr:HEAT repeat domain-containing protein [Sphaerisporangium fuscum]